MIDAMKKRYSVRTYQPVDLTTEDQIEFEALLHKKYTGPFSNSVQFESVTLQNNGDGQGVKLGTYGFIKNAKTYTFGRISNNREAIIDFGYTLEEVVLALASKNIGTCWLGGTFTRESFHKQVSLNVDEIIPAITPVGYPMEKKRFADQALRYVIKADKKLSWENLFFNEDFSKPLEKTEAGKYAEAIEMVRLGPSASNKQPWRIVQEQGVYHFYLEHTPNYSSRYGYDMQLLDIGIAMCHFELACKELGLEGNWEVTEPSIKVPNENIEYIASYRK